MDLYVKDFGAVGDGKTDDAKAIRNALEALRRAPEGSTLHFEAGKTYYFKENDIDFENSFASISSKPLFFFRNDSDLTVQGHNCLIKLGGYHNYYADIRNCNNIKLENIRFDYAEYKPAFAATVDSYDEASSTAIVTADRHINLEDGEFYKATTFPPMFGSVPTPFARYYLWIDQYEMLDAAARKVRIHFLRSVDEMGRVLNDRLNQQVWLVLKNKNLSGKYGLVLPMPRCGFKNEIAFEIRNNHNFTMRNVDVYSVPYHGLVLLSNTGTVLFENVNFVRAPYDQELGFNSWGDIYHLIHNRAKFIWKNCKNEYHYDDVFNVSASTLFVEEKYSPTEIKLTARNSWCGVPKILEGDTITIINTDTGEMIGRTNVKSVVEQDTQSARVILSDTLSGLVAGKAVYAWDDDTTCHPESEMIGCDMDGTFRARSYMTFTDCRFYIRRFWIGLECGAEGPLPRNLLFRNCDLTGDDGSMTGEDGRVWEIRSFNKKEGGYHVENIIFENCKGIDENKINKDPYDEVIFR